MLARYKLAHSYLEMAEPFHDTSRHEQISVSQLSCNLA